MGPKRAPLGQAVKLISGSLKKKLARTKGGELDPPLSQNGLVQSRMVFFWPKKNLMGSKEKFGGMDLSAGNPKKNVPGVVSPTRKSHCVLGNAKKRAKKRKKTRFSQLE